jgi:hypothetical protein
MGCSPGYIDGCNGNPGIWKTILVSGWEERTVKNCLKSAGLKNGKYREMDNGYETLYDIETAVKMKTRDDIKYLKKYEDHLNYHKTHEATKSSNQAQSLRKLLDMDKPQTQLYPNLPPSPVKVCVSKLKDIDTINSSVNVETSEKLNTDTNSTPHPNAKFLVMGAGTTIVNGCYEENGIHNNNPKYRQIDTYGYVVLHNDKPIEIVNGGGSYWWMGIWACADKGWFYLAENKDKTSSEPPKNGWNVVNHGIALFPTITFLNNEKTYIKTKKMYHGTATTWGDHTFWVYSPYLKLQNKWDTHLPVSTYCNHHIQHDANTFKCLGHINPVDFISAQKEWNENGWNEEWSGLENIKEEANDEPEEMFVGKKSYISQ